MNEIIENAKYVASEPSNKSSPDLLRTDRFEANTIAGGKPGVAKLRINVTPEGNKLYFATNEITGPTTPRPRDGQDHQRGIEGVNPITGINIPQTVNDVKIHDATGTAKYAPTPQKDAPGTNQTGITASGVKRPLATERQAAYNEKVSDIVNRLNAGESVPLEEIYSIPEIAEVINAEFDATIDLPNRDPIRANVLTQLQSMGSWDGTKYAGPVAQERRADIVIGVPAAGKSSVLVNPLSQAYKSRVIDSDMAKELLPEYNSGKGAAVVHDESSLIRDQLLVEAIARGDNFVWPTIGNNVDKLVKYIQALKNRGYTFYLHFNELDAKKATARAIARFFEEGRFVDPALIMAAGDLPTRTYEELKNRGGLIDGYSRYDNDVPRGQPARLVEEASSGVPDSGGLRQGRGIGWQGDIRSSRDVEKTEERATYDRHDAARPGTEVRTGAAERGEISPAQRMLTDSEKAVVYYELLATTAERDRLRKYLNAGISEQKAKELLAAFGQLTPEPGKGEVTDYQKIRTIMEQKLPLNQSVSLIADMYTQRDKDGSVVRESILPELKAAGRLVYMYLEHRKSALISMTVPEEFSYTPKRPPGIRNSGNKMPEPQSKTYLLTAAEKELFRRTYVKYFNSHLPLLPTAENVKKVRQDAYRAAKNAVVNSRK